MNSIEHEESKIAYNTESCAKQIPTLEYLHELRKPVDYEESLPSERSMANHHHIRINYDEED